MSTYGRDRAPLLVVLALAIAGCGSSDGTPGGGGDGGGGSDGGGAPAGSGTLTWLENGTMHTAIYPSGARVMSTMTDMVQVSGGDATGTGISLGVTMPPPLVPGTYPCGISGTGSRTIVSFSYTIAGLFQSCTITLTSVGAKTGDHAVGTFSATGGKMITAGVFDVPLTVSAL